MYVPEIPSREELSGGEAGNELDRHPVHVAMPGKT
jgi:hypothetical protein